jgi:F0F1-type ATP synthase membrane subunit b/b'
MKRFVDLGNECVEYQKVAKASEGKSHFQYLLIFACLTLLLCLTFFSSLSNSRALKAANARISSLEAKLDASRTAFDDATAAKVNAEKSAKSALAKAKKTEKDLANANKEHLQLEQAVAERLNQMSAAAGGTDYNFLSFC